MWYLAVGFSCKVGVPAGVTVGIGGAGVPGDVQVPLAVCQGGALGAVAQCVLDVLVVVHYWMDVV